MPDAGKLGGRDLTRISGLGMDTIDQAKRWHKVLSVGAKHSAIRARQTFRIPAMALARSDTALGTFYRSLCARADNPRANAATAYKLARMFYFMLTRGEDFRDKAEQHDEEQQRHRSIASLTRRAAARGFEVNPLSPST